MDEELEHLEAELIRLEPRAPATDTMRRIDFELARPAKPAKRADIRWIGLAVFAAAAAVAAMFVRIGSTARGRAVAPLAAAAGNEVSALPAGAIAATSALKPIADESMLVSARDEGVVTLDDGTRARRQRLEFVETITWKNPRTNASLVWSVPREEVRVVPISFQ
jgi:hypothetical protein